MTFHLSVGEIDALWRVEHPLLGYFYSPPMRARFLEFSPCQKHHAVDCVRVWHSRLPNTQDAPWMYAFKASFSGVTFAVALWNNPSARTLPQHWVELRRMAVAPDAPKFTASRFLGWMLRYLQSHAPHHEVAVSYQDVEVHTGTIYKATNWYMAHKSARRYRDRSKPRVGTTRSYRTNINGDDTDASEKIRWQYDLHVGAP